MLANNNALCYNSCITATTQHSNMLANSSAIAYNSCITAAQQHSNTGAHNMHTADADVGAMQLRIAFTYNDLEGCWTARVAQVLDNDGNEEWDIAAFNALVLSAFACYNAQATQQQLCKQLQATVAHNNSALYFVMH